MKAKLVAESLEEVISQDTELNEGFFSGIKSDIQSFLQKPEKYNEEAVNKLIQRAFAGQFAKSVNDPLKKRVLNMNFAINGVALTPEQKMERKKEILQQAVKVLENPKAGHLILKFDNGKFSVSAVEAAAPPRI
jgi:hypothetical protein